MASASTTGIKIVNISNLEKIENFLNDSAYREVIENSENYNTRLCIERRLRMPFLDPQTGVAQNHSALFMKRKQRMPGFRDGQLYTYPAARWRKSRRQYLTHQPHPRPFGMLREHHDGDSIGLDGSSIGAGDTDSKDSQNIREEVTKEWYYDEMDIHEMDAFHDPEPDSDYDYDDHYGSRRKKKKTPSRGGNRSTHSETPARRGTKTGPRGRRKNANLFNPESPHAASPSNRGTGPGSGGNVSSGGGANRGGWHRMPLGGSGGGPQMPHSSTTTPSTTALDETQLVSGIIPPDRDDTIPMHPHEESAGGPHRMPKMVNTPSPYCDFCLGDALENKKTKIPEELVSCSNCGRSGHPTCLQFTPNMIISVKRYRWQCIECKYCSICGTSDNDDQLLFCDDCDRGYHMYCLSPPLTVPPEGSWSCKLCLEEFHNQK